jgi:hypothetical protein
MRKSKKPGKKKATKKKLCFCPNEAKLETKEIHWCHFFLSKDIKIVVFDIIKAGYRVSFGPLTKSAADRDEPVYGYIEKAEKIVALISDCRCWPNEYCGGYKRAKTVVSVLSSQNAFVKLMNSLYKRSSKTCKCDAKNSKKK